MQAVLFKAFEEVGRRDGKSVSGNTTKLAFFLTFSCCSYSDTHLVATFGLASRVLKKLILTVLVITFMEEQMFRVFYAVIFTRGKY